MYPANGSSFVRLDGFSPEPLAIKLIPEVIARQYCVAPLWFEGEELVIACSNPDDRRALRALKTAIRRPIRPMTASYQEIRSWLDRIYLRKAEKPQTPETGDMLSRLGYRPSEGPLVPALFPENESSQEIGISPDLVSENGLAEAFGWRSSIPHLRAESLTPQPGLAALIPWEFARVRKVLPLWWCDGALIVATPIPEQKYHQEIARQWGIPVWPVLAPAAAWERAFRQLYLRGRPAQESHRAEALKILVNRGMLSEIDLVSARTISQQLGHSLPEILLERGLISVEQWLQAYSQVLGISTARITEAHRQQSQTAYPPKELARLIPPAIAKAYAILPLECTEDKVILGMQEPNQEAINLAAVLTGRQVEPRLVSQEDLAEHLEQIYRPRQRAIRERGTEIASLLLAMGMVTPAQLKEAEQTGPTGGIYLGERLIQLGYMDDKDLAEVLSIQTGIPSAGLEHACFDEALIRSIPAELARQHTLLPFYACGQDLWVAVADPLDGKGLKALEATTGRRVWALIAPRSIIAAAIDRFFGHQFRRLDPYLQRLLNLLTQRNSLTHAEAAAVIRNIQERGLALDQALLVASGLPEDKVTEILADLLNLPIIDLELIHETRQIIDPLGQLTTRQVAREPVDQEAANLISLETAQRLSALPVKRSAHAITVAFATPPSEAAIQELEEELGAHVNVQLASRGMLDRGIQRLLGRKNIGTYLLLAGVINRSQLNKALDLAQRTGVRLGRALLNCGYVTQPQFYHFLAKQTNLPYRKLSRAKVNEDTARLIDPQTARAYGMLPVSADEERLTLAIVDPLNNEALEVAAQLTGREVTPVLVSERDLETTLESIYRGEYLATSVLELLERSPDDSAFRVLSFAQILSLVFIGLLSILWLVVDYRSYLIAINALATAFYLSFSSYKFYLVYRSMTHDLEVPVEQQEVEALDDRELPIYTVLIPVYREAAVLPELLEAVANLDYPTTKLDIKVLMEADDADTIQAFHNLKSPDHIQAVIVPVAEPKTKPKACNYGLIHARGEYVVIFDAEDLPERDQLKRILIAFSKVQPEVVCIQSKLNYYNRNQNLLTRWFTVEYSMWFDLFLPGLDASDAPIPLGGTSNHFRRDALIDAGAWDPYNVTEDADLGIRMHKRGYRTAIVDTTTYEEANSHIYNWVRQRSRWIKGYIQTWLVHMRHPIRLWKEIGTKGFLGFQFVIGGTFFAALLNPVYWIMTTLWFVLKWQFVQEIFPGPVFYLGALCLYIGNFAFTFMNVAGAMRRGYYDMVKYALLSPLYWGLMSVGAWMGFIQLLTRPHFWEKTVHGLYEGSPQPDIEEANEA